MKPSDIKNKEQQKVLERWDKDVANFKREINKEANFYAFGYYLNLGLLGMFVLIFILTLC